MSLAVENVHPRKDINALKKIVSRNQKLLAA